MGRERSRGPRGLDEGDGSAVRLAPRFDDSTFAADFFVVGFVAAVFFDALFFTLSLVSTNAGREGALRRLKRVS